MKETETTNVPEVDDETFWIDTYNIWTLRSTFATSISRA
jgi:hypothetical protein